MGTKFGSRRHKPATEGWNDAKVIKAGRLYTKIVDLVAESLSVPRSELDELWKTGQMERVKLEIVPKGVSARDVIQEARKFFTGLPFPAEIEKPQPEAQPVQVHRQLPLTMEPTRKCIAPETGVLYRLKDEATGKYLHESCLTLIDDVRFAWKNDATKMAKVQERFALAKELKPEKIVRLV